MPTRMATIMITAPTMGTSMDMTMATAIPSAIRIPRA